jgi:DMSO/TMAO reductase YedYZ molybdopterin-dependent catalytic subunit
MTATTPPTPMGMDYTNEPPHSSLLTIQAKEPFNAEPSAAALVEFPITPEDLVYCRNHGPVRVFDEEMYRVQVGGCVKSGRSWTVRELKGAFGKREVVAVLQVCTLSLLYAMRKGADGTWVVRWDKEEGDGCY